MQQRLRNILLLQLLEVELYLFFIQLAGLVQWFPTSESQNLRGCEMINGRAKRKILWSDAQICIIFWDFFGQIIFSLWEQLV